MPAAVTDATFQEVVLDSDIPVVVDYWAEWCGPCKMIAPVLDQAEPALAGKAKIVKLNIDENPTTAAQFGIRGIPTLMIFKGGEPVSTKVGVVSATQFASWVADNS